MNSRSSTVALFLTFLAAPLFAGDIAYDAGRNCISVIGFTEEAPATMDAILAADREKGWRKISHDPATDTYTLDADLWIGDDKSNGTFVQIGDRDHPEVTVIVKGTVWVRPPRESPERSDGLPCIINRLRLGYPDDDTIRATLKIDCETKGQHGLYVGYRGPATKGWIERGSLHVYHSTITAARQDPEHVWGVKDYRDESASPRWASPGWYASDVRLMNATVSWFEGCLSYGLQTGKHDHRGPLDSIGRNEPSIVENTIFEHGDRAVQNGVQYLKNCTFRHMALPVAEGGSLNAKLVGCTFENNHANWSLGSLMSGGIVMIDCTAGKPDSSITIKKNSISAEQAARRNIPLYPACTMRKSLVVQVVDGRGNSVPEAFVIVSCKEHPKQVTRGATVTDGNGLTPADPEQDAIVITTKEYRATDEPTKPRVSTFRYTLSIHARGFPPKHVLLSTDSPVPKPLVVTVGE